MNTTVVTKKDVEVWQDTSGEEKRWITETYIHTYIQKSREEAEELAKKLAEKSKGRVFLTCQFNTHVLLWDYTNNN